MSDNNKYRHSLLAIFILMLALVGTAEAAVWRTCNDKPIKWRGALNIVRNSYSIPDTGNVNSAYWNGVLQWDRLSTVVDGFYKNPPSDTWITHGDGQNEVGLVNPSTIDGLGGLTVLQMDPCWLHWWTDADIEEADVMVANHLNFTSEWGNVLGNSGRGVFVHEFGHLFGFLHEEGHDIMRASTPIILTGGYEPATVWPSDTIGMQSIYGFSIAKANLLPSASGIKDGVLKTLDLATTITRCRGQTAGTLMYLGNSGNVASGTYNLRVRLSKTSPMSGYSQNTTVVSTFTHSANAFSGGNLSLPLQFTIPSSLPNGTYYIYVDMDYTKTVPEIVEGDNSTVSATRISVYC